MAKAGGFRQDATGGAHMANGRIRIGIGGWKYDDWRGPFYPTGLPQKRELAFAAERLTAIEVNGTFYGTLSAKTFASWRDETPDDFIFALKAPRYATNRRVLAEAGDSIARFTASGIAELGDKLGPINWQFAATKTFDAQDFEAFLKLLPAEAEGVKLRHALEVRHESFDCAAFRALAATYGVAAILAGDSAHPRIDCPAADFAYARIMGTSADNPLGYSEAQLDGWAAEARAIAATGRDLFLFVISGHKVLNPAAAMALIERLC
jgi:uncharacterized protein YecE (DUF72 family)